MVIKVSIITVVYNGHDTIDYAISSVVNQTYKDIEYIVVDGASTDGTVEIIKSHKDDISKFISQHDHGIYDAMNKGISIATGDIVGILNSDDFYKTDSIIEIVAKEFENKSIDCVYGDLEYVDSQDINKVVRHWKSQSFNNKLFKQGWHPAHPTFFVRKEIYNKYGMFDVGYKIAADYELMLRFLEKYKISSLYIANVFIKMRIGGSSNKSIKNVLIANFESYSAWGKNGLYINPILFLLKPLSKIKQLKWLH